MKVSKPLRILSVILVIGLITAAVTGIAVWSASIDPDKTTPGLVINGKLVEDPGTIMKIGDNDISFEEFRHYYLTNKSTIEQVNGANVWSADIDHAIEISLRKQTETQLQDLYAWQVIAGELGVELSEEQKKEIQDKVDEQKNNKAVNFEEYLANNFFITEDMYIRVQEMTKIQELAKEALTEKLKAEGGDNLGASIVTAQHILIKPFDPNAPEAPAAEGEEAAAEEEKNLTPEQEAEQMANAKTLADQLVQQIRESEDPAATFGELRKQYDNDPGQPEEGYTFGEGQMVDEFYAAALALKPGEISEPVKTEFGYHIIMRTETPEEEMKTQIDNILSNKVSELENEKLEKIREDLVIVKGDNFKYISPKTVK